MLVRPKRGLSSAERLRQLLDSGLFHLLWDRPGLLEKVSGMLLPSILFLHAIHVEYEDRLVDSLILVL